MDARPRVARFQSINPFRPLDWRRQHAEDIVARNVRLCPQRGDPESIELVHFLRALRRCDNERHRHQVFRRWPGHQAAFALASDNGFTRWEIEARILAGQTDEEVSRRCGFRVDAVSVYEAVFFNVRDRLRACDWIATRVIGPGLWMGFGPRETGKLWAAFAYLGGVRVLEMVMAVTLRRELPPWPSPSISEFAVCNLHLAARLAIEAMMACPAISWQDMYAIQRRRLRLLGDAPSAILAPMCRALDQEQSPQEAPRSHEPPPVRCKSVPDRLPVPVSKMKEDPDHAEEVLAFCTHS